MADHMSTLSAPKPRLTRACNACIKAKRKCSFDLPTCYRCQRRETVCKYENQPLTGQEIRPKPKRSVDSRLCGLHDFLSTNIASDEFYNSSPSLAGIRLDEPTWTLTVDEKTLLFLNKQLKEHVISFSRTGTNTFIHPKTPVSPLLTTVRSLTTALTSDQTFFRHSHHKSLATDWMSLLKHTWNTLFYALPNLRGYEDILPFTQSLILFQTLTLFVVPTSLVPEWVKQSNEGRHRLLKRITDKLWESTPTYLPSNLSRQEAYALAESVRRTVIMSHELQAQCSTYKRGFFEFRLFGASLPFDRRFNLWDAKASEFDEGIENKETCHGSEHMVSYREFCEMFDRMEVGCIQRPFETMILVGAKGLDIVEQRYGIHLA